MITINKKMNNSLRLFVYLLDQLDKTDVNFDTIKTIAKVSSVSKTLNQYGTTWLIMLMKNSNLITPKTMINFTLKAVKRCGFWDEYDDEKVNQEISVVVDSETCLYHLVQYLFHTTFGLGEINKKIGYDNMNHQLFSNIYYFANRPYPFTRYDEEATNLNEFDYDSKISAVLNRCQNRTICVNHYDRVLPSRELEHRKNKWSDKKNCEQSFYDQHNGKLFVFLRNH